MRKINNSTELEKLRKSILDKVDVNKPCVSICKSSGCGAFGADDIVERFRKELQKNKLDNKIDIKITGCHGFCERGPIIVIRPKGIFYQRCKPEHIPVIVSKTLINGELIDELLYADPNTGQKIPYEKDVPFYKKQTRLVLADCGKIDPTSIGDYIALGGYASLVKALFEMKEEKIINEVKQSGLRGRGGAGFPTGLKWEAARKQKSDIKYIICNADEGDPGAYMNRSVLESNPHSVIEGMIIGAYAIGSNEGWMYVRNEYPLAVENLNKAINDAREMGFLDENILGSKFNFDIKMAKGAGAFVCGEETALIASIEGKRGMPRQRPPFPAQHGLFGKPTNINNVETWANVPMIIAKGAGWFAKMGTQTSKGTKIFSLVGKVQNTGLVEVPMGTKLSEVVFDIGGGPPNNKKVKAVQTGGPSGGCIPKNMFHLPIDYESLKTAGAIMGSGGMIVMDESTCMVDIAKYFTNFLQEESCGKCVTCREGTQRMHEILTGITEGNGKESDLKLLEEMGRIIKDASMCGLGQTAPNPVLATMRYFRDEYAEHITKKRCKAVACKEIISSPCQHTCPIDTEAATYISLIAKGKYDQALHIIKKDNPLCSTLARVCNHPCESKCRAGDGGEPISIRGLKRFVTDYGLAKKQALKVKSAPKNGKGKVAVIGAGPAGLTCAFHLAQKGYETTVFEKLPVIGGMLAVAIPEYRLPRQVLNADLEYIKSAGINIRTNTALGKDITIDGLLKQGYKAIFIATGAHKSLKLGIPGEDAKGIYPSMELLREINLGNQVKIGRRVGVIGGGNSALDAARVALRSGKTESVTIFYRRTGAEMPAYKEEVEGAINEGIKIEFLTAPTKISAENGLLKKCHFVRMKLGDMDESGRRKPVPIQGSEFAVELDTLIVAISEQPEASYADKKTGLDIAKDGTITVNPETMATNAKGIFAGGDSVTGPNSVVEAVSAGKVAAASIEQFLNGQEVKRQYTLTRPSLYIEPVELSEKELAEAKRPVQAHLKPEQRNSNFKEVELGLTEAQAVNEAKRCLRCDLETKDGKKFIEEIKNKSKSKNNKEKAGVACLK
ncbi:MAG: FAD-dependent oxidoreductase [Candidatus Paceibacterota bacterium]